MECDSIIINQTYSTKKDTLRSNWVGDELTFNASDNDVAPKSLIWLQMECDSVMINDICSEINLIPDTNE